MQARPIRSTLSLFGAFALVFATTSCCIAEDVAPASDAAASDAPPPPAPAMGKIGPGAPGTAASKSAAEAAPARKGIHVSAVTPVASGVHVHDKVLEECHLQTMLPKAIASRNSDVVLSDAAGTRLELKISDIHAPSGGWFSGPKWVTVEGRLLDGKTLKGSFIVKETSMASATACGMLGKVIDVIGADIAEWLHHPTKNAKLGHAR